MGIYHVQMCESTSMKHTFGVEETFAAVVHRETRNAVTQKQQWCQKHSTCCVCHCCNNQSKKQTNVNTVQGLNRLAGTWTQRRSECCSHTWFRYVLCCSFLAVIFFRSSLPAPPALIQPLVVLLLLVPLRASSSVTLLNWFTLPLLSEIFISDRWVLSLCLLLFHGGLIFASTSVKSAHSHS